MSVTYSLKDPQTNIPVKQQVVTPIIGVFHFQGMRMKFGVGESVLPSSWNPAKKRMRANAKFADKINTYLDRMEDKVREVYLSLKSDFIEVTPDILRNTIKDNSRLGGKKITFMQFFDQVVEQKKEAKVKNIGVFTSVYSNLKKYPGTKNWADIGPDWFAKFQTWGEGYRDKVVLNGYSPNYIGKQISIIREVMSLAKKAGLHRNDQYKDTSFKKPSESVEAIYLTTDELMAIHRCVLPDHLARTRDIFLIGAFSGLRFSDSTKITLESVRDGLLFDRNTKTGTHTAVPVHWVIEEIFAKYPDGLPKSVSNQKFNDNLKDIGEKAGINTPIVHRQVKGGKVITETVPKYSMISSHTGRRSASTNMILAGIPAAAVQQITGHKTSASFAKYLKATSEESARSISDHPYFKKS